MATVAAVVLLGACDGTGPADVGAAGTATSTTEAATSVPEATTTSTSASIATTTTVRATTTTTMRRSTGDPRVVAVPPGAAAETRVSISGEGFTAQHWRTPNVPLWLAGGPVGCDFFADADHQVTVTAAGRLTGWFVVPSAGACRQSSGGDLPLAAGRYRIVYQCTACTVGDFDVTAGAPPATARCQDVGFTPNSDNMAADIVARGLPCSEAEAVVRKVGGPLGPINGAPQGEADGFTCRRASQDEGAGLPTATYECTRGSQRITFVRT
jgi:hypothetical protein